MVSLWNLCLSWLYCVISHGNEEFRFPISEMGLQVKDFRNHC